MENTGANTDDDNGGTERPPEAALSSDLLCEAVARKVCVTVTYNRKPMTLAPHAVFTKHGEPYLAAVTVDQEGKKPMRPKVGTFKLSGLTDIAITKKLFAVHKEFNAADPKFADQTICMIPGASPLIS